MSLPIALPAPPGHSHEPVWTGEEFVIGSVRRRIVSYEIGASGWTDELTEMHEDVDDETHYINVASREHAVSRVERWAPSKSPLVIDIGCSSGYTVKLLRARMPHATVIGADYVRGPLEKLGRLAPDLPLLHFDLVRCPLPDDCFDAIVLLNVLEHVEDDVAALRQVARILRQGGIAAIEVPAGPGLYDIYDRQLMHFRRYRMKELANRIHAAGLTIVERSHLGFFLYPGFWIVKKRNRKYLDADRALQQRIVAQNMRQGSHSALMAAIMRMEARLRDSVYFPCGIRCVVTCRKP
jgi:SAM-dependent methyltransferase